MTRQITIEPVINGFIVKIGCQRVVVDSATKLGSEITRYYQNPEEVEKEYITKAINQVMDVVQPPCESSTSSEHRLLRTVDDAVRCAR